MFSLDRDSPTPLADQIEQRLRALIGCAQLPPGARLNSIRQLAAQLGVSPNTVVIAYDRLVAAGLIDSRGTAGFFVAEGPADAMPDAVRVEAGEEQEAVWLAQQANDQRSGVLLASSGALPATWLEEAVPAAAVQRGLARAHAGMATRCPPQGLPELRECIATLLRSQGIAVDAGRVLTTYGGTQAIDLICRALLRPGDSVAVETPGYFLLFDRLRQAGVNIVPVPRRHDGIDLAALDEACTRHRPRLLFIQSVLHNPTGWGSTAANLHRVLMLAQRHGVLIAEDDVQGHFHPGTPTRLAQLSALDGVIYYSSFCKAMSPSLRLGYMAAEPGLLKALLREKIVSVLTTAALNEFVLLEVLSAGRWRKHLDRLQQRLATARVAATRQLRQAGVQLEHPGEGGLFLWGALPAGADVDGVVKEAFRRGILLVRGATFAADGASDPHIRFNAAFSQQPRLAQYLQEQLGAAASARLALERARSPHPPLGSER
ncbi:aminotransferase-like domain-containing protein [Pelomonas aquatica]|jgi:DNA-binding transcriptional MocR family regulator|uniref:PLP-dependent aminotransferase family protein n=1 Tax=Pelomonas aquatica TaxID=431058 RepID=A0A9X4LEB7_9BURK|nr:PLP-dependent aminotransferase family protein [Pelomonas aquatica]MCY4754377.1 PLP-dependent aminotransferase family protein [Pelomonas aquatica]MDG0861573.1 PLP-dependent aminotransferase family protein [Pelomonas aquatica]